VTAHRYSAIYSNGQRDVQADVQRDGQSDVQQLAVISDTPLGRMSSAGRTICGDCRRASVGRVLRVRNAGTATVRSCGARCFEHLAACRPQRRLGSGLPAQGRWGSLCPVPFLKPWKVEGLLPRGPRDLLYYWKRPETDVTRRQREARPAHADLESMQADGPSPPRACPVGWTCLPSRIHERWSEGRGAARSWCR
jgi:hypothetical protein